MKKRIFIIILCAMCSILFVKPAHGQVLEIIKEAATKVIKAIDLKIQALQTKTVWLQNAQKTLENKMTKLKLKQISDWTERQRDLYQKYYEELLKVKAAISTYKEVKAIIVRQKELMREYSHAWQLLKRDNHFTPEELSEMYRVYSGILDESLKNLEELQLVINSFRTQMSDGKRLELIHAAGAGIDDNLTDLRSFNNRNFHISLSRSRSVREADMIKQLYGIQ
jgi:hypothetical protein